MARGSNVLKVNLGWGLLIVGGIGSFVLARNNVLAKRQQHMRTKQGIKEAVEKEVTDTK